MLWTNVFALFVSKGFLSLLLEQKTHWQIFLHQSCPVFYVFVVHTKDALKKCFCTICLQGFALLSVWVKDTLNKYFSTICLQCFSFLSFKQKLLWTNVLVLFVNKHFSYFPFQQETSGEMFFHHSSAKLFFLFVIQAYYAMNKCFFTISLQYFSYLPFEQETLEEMFFCYSLPMLFLFVIQSYYAMNKFFSPLVCNIFPTCRLSKRHSKRFYNIHGQSFFLFVIQACDASNKCLCTVCLQCISYLPFEQKILEEMFFHHSSAYFFPFCHSIIWCFEEMCLHCLSAMFFLLAVWARDT